MSNLLAALQQADAQYETVEAAAGGFELHPVGKYIAEVTQARVEEGNGKVQLFVKFETEKGSPATWITLAGFSDKNTEKQVGFSKNALLQLGHEGAFADLVTGGTEHLIGRKAEIQIKHNTYEGTTREQVYINKPVEGVTDSGEAAGFAAQFQATPVNTDDVPF